MAVFDANLSTHYFSELDVLMFILPKVGVALLVGTLIGIEREYRGKLAGIKTNALICTASALFTAVSVLMAHYGSSGTPNDPLARNPDVTRIVAQIVSGIGFVGAGAIFKSSSKVQGLTTAAVIWFTSALGIMIGFGIFLSSIVITVASILFLSVVSTMEKKFFRVHGGMHGYPHSTGPSAGPGEHH